MTAHTALLLGPTGLIGGHLLDLLLDDPGYHKVSVLTRRPLGRSHPRLCEVQAQLDQPDQYRDHAGADDIFCCLGTTMKKAGSPEAFRKVDLEYPLAVAQAGCAAGASQYLIVTAVGADARSGIFYNRTKGEVEDALRALPFRRGVKIFRPSMLLGDRGESRPLEQVGAAIMRWTAPLFAGPLQRYRAIPGAAVARALWRAARQDADVGSRTYEGADLFQIAG